MTNSADGRRFRELPADERSRYRTVARHMVQGCSTLSTGVPLEQRIESGESGGVAILTEG